MMRLAKDIYTIYGNCLVKKKELVTPLVVRRIRAAGARHKQVIVRLKNTEVFPDFEKVFDDERYTTMFKPPISVRQICDVAGRLDIENDLLFELSTMKRNLPYTYNHLLIVAAFAIKLALVYKPREYDAEIVSRCGFTHDLGKARIPIVVLKKRDLLTREERRIIEMHPVIGYLLLNYYLKSNRRECASVSLDHHERLDGSGYPKGIKRLGRYTQLICAVDVMDALMTRRPYRDNAYSLRTALDYLLKESNEKRLNKDIVLILISIARKNKPDIHAMKISRTPREALPPDISYDKYR